MLIVVTSLPAADCSTFLLRFCYNVSRHICPMFCVYCTQAGILRSSLLACGRTDLADYVAAKHEESSQQQLMHAAKGYSYITRASH